MSGMLLLLHLFQTVLPGVLTADDYVWPYPFVGLEAQWGLEGYWQQSGGVFSLYDSMEEEGSHTSYLILEVSGVPADVVELELQCNTTWFIHGYSSWPMSWAYSELTASLDYPFEEVFFQRLGSCGGEDGEYYDQGTEMLDHIFSDTRFTAVYIFAGTTAASFAGDAYIQWTLEDFVLIGHTTASLETGTWARMKAAFL